MRFPTRIALFPCLGLLLTLLAAAGTAHAQLKMGLEAERMNYLLYERLPLKVTLENTAGFDLSFADAEGKPWLSFYVTQDDGSFVPADRKGPQKPLLLPAGKRAGFTVDLTPLYAIRSPGRYKVQAVVDVADREYLSAPIFVTIASGQTVWKERRAIDGSMRTYSLVRFSPTQKNTDLYLRVEDEAQNIVYTNILLGEAVDFETPATQFDAAGKLHILNLAGTALYRYSRANPDGVVEAQATYFALNESSPRLQTTTEGGVFVAGGREENPAIHRDKLSDAQSRVLKPVQ